MVCAYMILGHDDRRVGFSLGIACCQNTCFVPGCETFVFLCVCYDKTFSTDLWRSILEDSHTGILSFSTVRTQTQLNLEIYFYTQMMLTHYCCDGNIWQFIFYIVSECLTCCMRLSLRGRDVSGVILPY